MNFVPLSAEGETPQISATDTQLRIVLSDDSQKEFAFPTLRIWGMTCGTKPGESFEKGDITIELVASGMGVATEVVCKAGDFHTFRMPTRLFLDALWNVLIQKERQN
jgi:hypothetical protein